MSADAMINSLLQKSDTFKKVNSDLPAWLQKDSPLCCPFYEKVWEIVKTPSQYAETSRVSQILLTSGLHPDILGFIWNLANKTTPGVLTQQELYIVLALVGLAQSGCTFNNLTILNMVPSAPIPRLHVPFQPMPSQAPVAAYQFSGLSNAPQGIGSSTSAPAQRFNEIIPSTKSQTMETNDQIGSKVNYNLDRQDDDFQDFQSVSPVNK